MQLLCKTSINIFINSISVSTYSYQSLSQFLQTSLNCIKRKKNDQTHSANKKIISLFATSSIWIKWRKKSAEKSTTLYKFNSITSILVNYCFLSNCNVFSLREPFAFSFAKNFSFESKTLARA